MDEIDNKIGYCQICNTQIELVWTCNKCHDGKTGRCAECQTNQESAGVGNACIMCGSNLKFFTPEQRDERIPLMALDPTRIPETVVAQGVMARDVRNVIGIAQEDAGPGDVVTLSQYGEVRVGFDNGDVGGGKLLGLKAPAKFVKAPAIRTASQMEDYWDGIKVEYEDQKPEHVSLAGENLIGFFHGKKWEGTLEMIEDDDFFTLHDRITEVFGKALEESDIIGLGRGKRPSGHIVLGADSYPRILRFMPRDNKTIMQWIEETLGLKVHLRGKIEREAFFIYENYSEINIPRDMIQRELYKKQRWATPSRRLTIGINK